MKSFFNLILLTAVVTVISGCQLTQKTTGPVKPNSDDSSQVSLIELPPKIISTDWKAILSPLVDELLQTTIPSENNLLFISDTKNNSGEYIATTRINAILTSLFSQQDLFVIADKTDINKGKQQLGIPFDDTLVSRSKMIALARYLKTDYVLFTTINATPKQLEHPADVAMELISTKSGEIIWRFASAQLSENNVNDPVIDDATNSSSIEIPESEM